MAIQISNTSINHIVYDNTAMDLVYYKTSSSEAETSDNLYWARAFSDFYRVTDDWCNLLDKQNNKHGRRSWIRLDQYNPNNDVYQLGSDHSYLHYHDWLEATNEPDFGYYTNHYKEKFQINDQGGISVTHRDADISQSTLSTPTMPILYQTTLQSHPQYEYTFSGVDDYSLICTARFQELTSGLIVDQIHWKGDNRLKYWTNNGLETTISYTPWQSFTSGTASLTNQFVRGGVIDDIIVGASIEYKNLSHPKALDSTAVNTSTNTYTTPIKQFKEELKIHNIEFDFSDPNITNFAFSNNAEIIINRQGVSQYFQDYTTFKYNWTTGGIGMEPIDGATRRRIMLDYAYPHDSITLSNIPTKLGYEAYIEWPYLDEWQYDTPIKVLTRSKYTAPTVVESGYFDVLTDHFGNGLYIEYDSNMADYPTTYKMTVTNSNPYELICKGNYDFSNADNENYVVDQETKIPANSTRTITIPSGELYFQYQSAITLEISLAFYKGNELKSSWDPGRLLEDSSFDRTVG